MMSFILPDQWNNLTATRIDNTLFRWISYIFTTQFHRNSWLNIVSLLAILALSIINNDRETSPAPQIKFHPRSMRTRKVYIAFSFPKPRRRTTNSFFTLERPKTKRRVQSDEKGYRLPERLFLYIVKISCRQPSQTSAGPLQVSWE